MATTLSQYNVAILAELVNNKQEANTFLQETIFGDKGVNDKTYIELHRYENNDGLLEFSENPDKDREVINPRAYEKIIVNSVYIKGKVTLDASDLLTLQAGETSGTTLATDRARRILARIGDDVSDTFLNTKEKIAAELITTGKYKDRDGIETSYPIPSENMITITNANDKWGNVNADIHGQLQEWQNLTAESGMEADTVIMGGTAYSNFLRNEGIKSLMENRRIDIGNITVENIGSGVKSAGVFNDMALKVYCYTAKVGGQFLIPTNAVIMINSFKPNANFYHTHNGRDDFNGQPLQLTPYRDEENGKQQLAVDSGLVAALHVPAGVFIATVN